MSHHRESYISLSFPRHFEPVARAEHEAHQMMEAAGVKNLAFHASDEDWIAAFGDTEEELEEHMAVLARRYRNIPFWRRADRRAVLNHYISVKAMLTVSHGLETVWR